MVLWYWTSVFNRLVCLLTDWSVFDWLIEISLDLLWPAFRGKWKYNCKQRDFFEKKNINVEKRNKKESKPKQEKHWHEEYPKTVHVAAFFFLFFFFVSNSIIFLYCISIKLKLKSVIVLSETSCYIEPQQKPMPKLFK